MASQEFRVRVELRQRSMSSNKGVKDAIDIQTSDKDFKPTKENDEPKDGKGGKNTQDGKSEDHQSSHLPVKLSCKLKVSDLIIACNGCSLFEAQIKGIRHTKIRFWEIWKGGAPQ